MSTSPLSSASWPRWLALGLLAVLLVGSYLRLVRLTGGPFAYVLDDAYIHMSMARHLVEDGTYGVTRHGYSSSSSSPLWTALLALVFQIFGVHDWWPLVLNALAAGALVLLLDHILRAHAIAARPRALSLGALVLVGPLPALAFTGQEHILHSLVTIGFVHAVVSATGAPARATTTWIYLLAPLVTGLRYEGLFTIAIAAGLLVEAGRARAALLSVLLGLLPVTAVGLVSVSRGWYFLPNSILLKGQAPDLGSLGGWARALGYHGMRHLLESPHLLVLVLGSTMLLVVRLAAGRGASPASHILLLFIANTLLQAQFAGIGWFYRYEAYLICLAILGLTLASVDLEPGQLRRPGWAWSTIAVSAAVAVMSVVPLGRRAVESLQQLPRAARNIHEQQVQMGRFLAAHYTGERVAVNDIGAANYLADIRCLDLWGLASLDVAARKRRDGSLDQAALRALTAAHGTAIAVIYDNWFEQLPGEWIQVGQWTIRDRVITGGERVSFYAIAPREETRLLAALRAFAPELPASVLQTGAYTALSEHRP